jgi:hypothetical protein
LKGSSRPPRAQLSEFIFDKGKTIVDFLHVVFERTCHFRDIGAFGVEPTVYIGYRHL